MIFHLSSGGQGQVQFDAMKNSVLWGCPSWDGWVNTSAASIGGVSKFDNGYSLNWLMGYTNRYPVAAGVQISGSETLARSTAISYNGVAAAGKWYRLTSLSQSSDRCLVVDSTLWLLGFGVTTPGGKVQPQSVGRSLQTGAGQSNIDLFRHGKVPSAVGGVYPLGRGQIAYNMVFCDGHAVTLRSADDGYKAIRLRPPGQ
jgi:prepilin-type processing-associated H-X9-DG protein